METEKIGFFKRFKMAIFNLEKYSIFANEKFSKALKYLLIIVLLVTVALAISSTIQLSNEAKKLIEYVKSDDIPNFELKDGKLVAEGIINAYNDEYNSRMIVDTTEELSEEVINEYKNEVKGTNYAIILLNDKLFYRFDENQTDVVEGSYGELTSLAGISDLSKEKLVNEYLNEDNLFKYKMILGVYAFITILLMNIITLLEDIIIIGVFGWIAAKIARVKITLGKAMSLAIYSLTLSIILSTIYSIVYSFTGFTIKYFEIMYMIIAYIYIVAAIMIMKDANRTAGEAVTVEGQVLKTGDDEENKEDDEKDKDKDKKEEDKKDEKKEEDNKDGQEQTEQQEER